MHHGELSVLSTKRFAELSIPPRAPLFDLPPLVPKRLTDVLDLVRRVAADLLALFVHLLIAF